MPAKRRVELDESNAQWAHRPKGTTAKRARLPHQRKRLTFGRPRVMRSKARNACNTKKAKGSCPWPSSLSGLATRGYPRAFFRRSLGTTRQYPQSLLLPRPRCYSATPASASFAAAAMREKSPSFGWLCALFQLSISMRARAFSGSFSSMPS